MPNRSADLRQRNRFTLVELIVVLVIMSVMMGMGIAAYRNVGTHLGPKAGAQRMADMIALARQKAIMENARVALLLPERSASGSHQYDDADYGVQVGICEVDKGHAFVRWIEGASWVNAPERSYFHASNFLSVTGIPGIADTNAIIFMPNGTLESNLFKNAGAAIWVKPYSTSTTKYEPGSGDKYRITVNWITGIAATERYR